MKFEQQKELLVKVLQHFLGRVAVAIEAYRGAYQVLA
jgi:hypothetical protein